MERRNTSKDRTKSWVLVTLLILASNVLFLPLVDKGVYSPVEFNKPISFLKQVFTLVISVKKNIKQGFFYALFRLPALLEVNTKDKMGFSYGDFLTKNISFGHILAQKYINVIQIRFGFP